MSTAKTLEGEALRFSLVSSRPIPQSLRGYIASTLERHGVTGSYTDISTGNYFAETWLAADATETADLAFELRGPAMALAVDSALTQGALASNGPQLIVTDVDSTLIEQEVIELLARSVGTEEQVHDITARAMRGELDFAHSLRERVATLAGAPDSIFDTARASITVTPGARELIDAIHERGGKFGIVSGGFHEVVDPVAADLGVDFVLANRLDVVDGVLTGKVSSDIVTAEVKAQTLHQWCADLNIAPEEAVTVGDGANDLKMLGDSGLGVAFRAKPIVVENADCAISFARLDATAALVGWQL